MPKIGRREDCIDKYSYVDNLILTIQTEHLLCQVRKGAESANRTKLKESL